MRYTCNRCGQGFSLMGETNKRRLFAFTHNVLKDMTCPECGSRDITLYIYCQSRLSGSVYSVGGQSVSCDGCPQAFNCYTGNLDDGTGADVDRDRKIKEAKAHLARREQEDDKRDLDIWRNRLANVGVSFFYTTQWNLRFLGTIYKLDGMDVVAVMNDVWDTKRTKEIKNGLTKRGVNPTKVKSLFRWENHYRIKYREVKDG